MTRSPLRALGGRGQLIWTLVAFAALGGAVQAEDTRPDLDVPLTAMAAGPLGRATVVVVAEIEHVRQTRGLVLARVRPLQTLKGKIEEAGSLVILVRGPKAVDPDTPSLVRGKKAVLGPVAPAVPYLVEGATGRYVFFLDRRPDGIGFVLETLFDATGKVGGEKVKALETHVALGRIRDPAERARRTLVHLIESGSKGGTWTRVNAARELNYLVEVKPDVFDARSLETLRRQARRSSVPMQRTWLTRLLRTFEDCAGGQTPAAEEPPVADQPDPKEAEAPGPAGRIAILERYLHEGGNGAAGTLLDHLHREEASVRAWAVTALAEGGYRQRLPGILRLYAQESSVEVLRAVVRAVGLLGSETDVQWLRARLANGRVFKEVLFALARIRTPTALQVLGQVRDRAQRSTPPRDDIVALVDYLTGVAFAEVEAAAGHSVPFERPR